MIHSKDDSDFKEEVSANLKKCLDHTKEWRDNAREEYNFVAGEQWSMEEKSTMEEHMRSPVTFNKLAVFVNAITGLETINRQEARIYSRVVGRQGPDELWNSAISYVNDDSYAEEHHSNAFRDLVICGMGWSETFMDYERNVEGDVRIVRRHPMRMYWDKYATQRNLEDANWIANVDYLNRDDVESKWGEIPFETAKLFSDDEEFPSKPHDQSRAFLYEEDQARRTPDDERVQVVHYQWVEREPTYVVLTPNGVKEYGSDQFTSRVRQYADDAGIRYVRRNKRVYYRAFFAGQTLLEKEKSPTQEGFTFHCMTGNHDVNDNVWYGIVRALKHPQEWLNKLYSQILHIISTNAKGGLIAEEDAFDDLRKAKNEWAKADSIVTVSPGAIAAPKIMPKPPPPYPQMSDKLMGVANSMFPDVSGLNLELLGLASKVQAGVLEAQRKQAGMTILAWAFDAMRKYRKMHGRVLADYIRQFLADGRLIRIAQEGEAQYIPLMRDSLAIEYDIIVDESPTSPNQKERVFALLIELIPALQSMNIGLSPEILDYLPLPQSLITKLKQQAQPSPEQQAMQQLGVQNAVAEVDETKSKAELNRAKAVESQLKAVTG